MTPPTFKLSPEALQAYRALRYDENARPAVSWIPISGLFWSDEHPGGDGIGLPRDEGSQVAILQLLAARAQLWRTGAIPEELQAIWDEAKALLPDWPGFRRLSLTEEQARADLAGQSASDQIWEVFQEDEDEVSEEEDGTGWVQKLNTWTDLTKDKP